MKQYAGMELVKAVPMSKDVACREGIIKLDECKKSSCTSTMTDGYKIVYSDGCTSWKPKDVFDDAYRPTGDMVFGFAIELIKMGYKVTRRSWGNGEVFLFLVPGSTFKVNRPPLLGAYPEGTEINYLAHIDIKTADGEVMPWFPSQDDMLAEDYIRVEIIHK